MTKQFESSPSQKKISSLYKELSNEPKELILQPFFQRRLVWNNNHKAKFIETILKGYPVPEIYISQSGVDLQKISTEDVVVDGQQRLSTIIQYIEDSEESFSVSENIPRYSELTTEMKTDFLSYKLVVRDLGSVSESDLKEIFSRINSTNYGLNAVEINNALYTGDFMTSAKEFIKQTNFSSDLDFLNENAINRMEDINYILLIMSTIIEEGYFSGSDPIEKYIEIYDDNFENKEEILKNMSSIFNFISLMNLDSDSIWYRKSNYFTLFCELYWKYNNRTDELENNKNNIRSSLIRLEKSVIDNKNNQNNNFGKYYSAMYSGTNNRTSRVTRGSMVRDVL